jgi:hypothetical protein
VLVVAGRRLSKHTHWSCLQSLHLPGHSNPHDKKNASNMPLDCNCVYAAAMLAGQGLVVRGCLATGAQSCGVWCGQQCDCPAGLHT